MLAGAGLLLVALAVAPFAGILRRRETAWITGGLAALIVCALVPPLPGALGKLVSVNQIRRLPFLEMPWLLVARRRGRPGGAAAAGARWPSRSSAGIVLGVAVPRHTTLRDGAAVVVCVGVGRRPRPGSPARGVSLPAPDGAWLVALALAGAVGARRRARPGAGAGRPAAGAEHRSRPAPIRAVRALPKFTVIASDPQSSLLLTSLTDALVYSVPPGNTADTPANKPTDRCSTTAASSTRRRRRGHPPALLREPAHRLPPGRSRAARAAGRASWPRQRFVKRFADPRFALFCHR